MLEFVVAAPLSETETALIDHWKVSWQPANLHWRNGITDVVDCYSFVEICTPFTLYITRCLYDLFLVGIFSPSMTLLMPYYYWEEPRVTCVLHWWMKIYFGMKILKSKMQAWVGGEVSCVFNQHLNLHSNFHPLVCCFSPTIFICLSRLTSQWACWKQICGYNKYSSGLSLHPSGIRFSQSSSILRLQLIYVFWQLCISWSRSCIFAIYQEWNSRHFYFTVQWHCFVFFFS